MPPEKNTIPHLAELHMNANVFFLNISLTFDAITVTVVTDGRKDLAQESRKHVSEDTTAAKRGRVCATRVPFITCSMPSTLAVLSP